MSGINIDEHMDNIYKPTDEIRAEMRRVLFAHSFKLKDGRSVKFKAFGPKGIDAMIWPERVAEPEGVFDCGVAHIEFGDALNRTGGGGFTYEGAVECIDKKEADK